MSPHPSLVDILSIDEARGRIVMAKEDMDLSAVLQNETVLNGQPKCFWMR